MSSIGWHTYVLRWESESPDAPALIGPDETLNFRQLAWRGRKFAAGLQRAGVKRGQVVMVRARRDYDYQFTLALSMLGAIGVSNTAQQYLAYEAQTDWLITRKPVAEYPREKQIVVDDPWLQRAFNNTEPFEIMGLESEDSIERICLTSGTTGQPRAIAVSHRQHHQRVVSSETAALGKGVELYLVDMGAAIGAMRAFAAALEGLPYLHMGTRKTEELSRLFQRVPIKRLAGAPLQILELLALLKRLRIDHSALEWIRAGGAKVSAELIAAVSAVTSNPIQIGYGSTEVGTVAMRTVSPADHPDSVGKLLPGVRAQVVDQTGVPVANGNLGTLRLKTDYSATEYRGDAEASAASFKDGWFYPGDRAIVTDDGELLILGRESEVINLGGVKIDPTAIERLVDEFAGVSGAVAFGWQDFKGVERLAIAIDKALKPNLKLLEREIAKRYKYSSKVELLTLSELPRNEAGKVLRAQLAELARSRFA